MISKHHNHDYGVSYPVSVGDRYYVQDLGRDFWYLLDRMGYSLKDLLSESKVIISGGVVSKGVGTLEINVTECIAYIKFEVDILNGAAGWVLPPSFTQEDIEFIRVKLPAQTNFSDNTNDNNVTTNYVKLSYNDADGTQTRARAKTAGSYNFDKTPSFVLTMDDVAPTIYEIELARFVTVAGSVPTTFDLSGRTKELPGIMQNNQTTLSTNYTIQDYESIDTYILTPSTNQKIVITLPTASANTGKRIKFIKGNSNYATCVIDGEGSEEIDQWTEVVLFKEGETVEIEGNGVGWDIVNNWKWTLKSGKINCSDWTNIRYIGFIAIVLNDSTGFEQWEVVTETGGNRGIVIYNDTAANTVFIIYTDDGSGGVAGFFTAANTLTGQTSSETDTISANTKNVDSLFQHRLGLPIIDLNINAIISSDGTDDNSWYLFTTTVAEGAAVTHGSTISGNDDNSFRIEIPSGAVGRYCLQEVLADPAINIVNQDYYYEIIINNR